VLERMMFSCLQSMHQRCLNLYAYWFLPSMKLVDIYFCKQDVYVCIQKAYFTLNIEIQEIFKHWHLLKHLSKEDRKILYALYVCRDDIK
jgi:hypothetical protein